MLLINQGLSARARPLQLIVGAWLAVGLVVDGWAHQFRDDESFWTPWHLLLYTGFTATVLTNLPSLRSELASARARTPYTVIGIVAFAVGGLADSIWHTIFGVEASIAAVLSPPHTLLFVGGFLLVLTPWRLSQNSDNERERVFGVLSLWLGFVFLTFFFMYLSPFRFTVGGRDEADWIASFSGNFPATVEVQMRTIGGIMLINLLVQIGLLLSHYHLRGRPSFAPAIGLFILPLASTGLSGFRSASTVLPIALAWFSLVLALTRSRWWQTEQIAGLVIAFLAWALWLIYFGIVATTEGLVWDLEIWTGVTVWAGIAGWGVSAVGSQFWHGARNS